MNASLIAVLSDSERLLVAQTEAAELATFDEDAAIELEARIRRARNKYTSQYRRGASARVAEEGGRGKARPENRRAAMKAEAFEEALSRVSRRVAVLARQSAAKLRAERLEAAKAGKQAGPRELGAAPDVSPQRAQSSPRSPPVAVPCARPPVRSAGQAPAPWVPAGRRSETAGEH